MFCQRTLSRSRLCLAIALAAAISPHAGASPATAQPEAPLNPANAPKVKHAAAAPTASSVAARQLGMPRTRGNVSGLANARRRPDGALVVTGKIAGNGVIADTGTRVIQGKVAPGNSPGCVTDQGNVVFEGSGSLEIELGGPTACTGYDQYTVNLSLTVNGATLQVLLISGFTPVAGQRFDILNWGTLTGTFGAIQLPALPEGLAWSTASLYTTGELVVVSAPSGDVPLPAWALLLLGGGLLGSVQRWLRKAG